MSGLVPLLKGVPDQSDSNEAKIYAIQFPSPFNEDDKDLNEKMSYGMARKQFFKVFKTSKKIQRPKGDQELQKSEKKKLDSDVIPDLVKKSVSWLYGPEKDEDDSVLTRRSFLKEIISAVLFTIQYELNLNYTLLESRDKDEIFCQIYAKESWLELKAQSEEYRLQFRPDPSDAGSIGKFPFKEVAPYAKYEIPEGDKQFPERVNQLFKHFDSSEQPSESGSLFMYTDKVRLVRNSLNTRIDMHKMKELEISIEDFCIHSQEPLEELKNTWARMGKLFSAQPLDKIRNYFGEKAALYFAWMELYQSFMISAGILGIAVQVIVFLTMDEPNDGVNIKTVSQVLFAIFLAWWASSFDQMWARREKIIAWKWGTTSFYEEEEQRGEFEGLMQRDPVSNKMKRKRINEFWHKLRVFISYSVVLVFVVGVAGMIGSILFLRYVLIGKEDLTLLGLIMAGVLNALQIRFMNIIYGKIAVVLNDWENHETETEYNNKLAMKVFMFKFVNSYSSLFYLAYFADLGIECTTDNCLTNMDALAYQLGIIFGLSLLMNFVEIIVPWMLMKRRMIAEDMHVSRLREKNPEIREKMYPIEKEAKCESYESPLEDYIEMIIEFGYVVMFATALPALPAFLLIEIVFEVRVDAWKMCNQMKRADPHRSEDIGVFKDIIVFIAYMGAINNAGIIVFPSGLFDSIVADYADSTAVQVLIFIVFEHILIVGMFLISVMVPDDPEVVQKGLIWSERIINEKLYKIPTNKGRADVGGKNEGSEIDFELSEAKIRYNE